MDDLDIDDRVRIPARDLRWSAARSGGPGGQNVNRVATKVDLRFDLPGTTALSEAVKRRVRTLYGHRLDAEGHLIVIASSARTQARNLGLARAKLADMLRRALSAPRPRRPTRPTRASRAKRLQHKRARGQTKALRGKVPRE